MRHGARAFSLSRTARACANAIARRRDTCPPPPRPPQTTCPAILPPCPPPKSPARAPAPAQPPRRPEESPVARVACRRGLRLRPTARTQQRRNPLRRGHGAVLGQGWPMVIVAAAGRWSTAVALLSASPQPTARRGGSIRPTVPLTQPSESPRALAADQSSVRRRAVPVDARAAVRCDPAALSDRRSIVRFASRMAIPKLMALALMRINAADSPVRSSIFLRSTAAHCPDVCAALVTEIPEPGHAQRAAAPRERLCDVLRMQVRCAARLALARATARAVSIESDEPHRFFPIPIHIRHGLTLVSTVIK